jgi:TonB family protein
MKTLAILSVCCATVVLGASLVHGQSSPAAAAVDEAAAVIPGEATHKVEPKYPKEGLEKKIQGTVILHGTIAKDGSVSSLSTVSGDPVLAQAVIDAARKWRYEPYELNQVRVETQIAITVTFRIDDAGVAMATPMEAVRSFQAEDSIPKPSAVQAGETYDGPVIKIGSGVSPPRAISSPSLSQSSPSFTKVKFEGTSVLQLVVGPDGRPYNIKVIRPLGMGLDQKAVEAVSQWKFQPATKDGKPVAVLINVEVQFHLY